MSSRVVLRADGSAVIGFGHVYRLLALSEMLSPFYDCMFFTKKEPGIPLKQIEALSRDVIFVENTNEEEEINFLLKQITAEDIIVLDGYGFSELYQQAIKRNGNKLVCIDDIAGKHFYSDVVINHAGEIEKKIYRREPYTELYLGVQYALLRKIFLDAAALQRGPLAKNNIFIAFGGSDHFNLPLQALETCEQIKEVEKIHLVLPSESRNAENIKRFISNSKKQIQTWQDLQADKMINIMQECRLAIVSSSTIAYEICCVKMGIIAVRFTDNQNNLSHFLKKNNLSDVIDWNKDSISENLLNKTKQLLYDQHLIERQMKNQQAFFDGGSAERVLLIFDKLAHA